MARSLHQLYEARQSNFGLLRFLAATAVLFSHSFAIVAGSGDAEPLRGLLGMTPGTMAVDVFFVTSGYLVAGSLVSRRTLGHFVWARVLRIFPGLVVATAISILVLGLGFTTLPAPEFLTHRDTVLFALKNCTLFAGIRQGLPGVFVDAPLSGVFNGSLWTLPWEVRVYALLALLWLFLGKANRGGERAFGLTCAVTAGLGLLAHAVLTFCTPGEFEQWDSLARFTGLFFAGSAAFLLRDRIVLSGRVALALTAAVVCAALHHDVFFVVYHLALPYLILTVAYLPSQHASRFDRRGDYSYGMYVYAFPVQQSVVALLHTRSPGLVLGVSFAVTLLLAIASWHGVEKRALALKQRFAG